MISTKLKALMTVPVFTGCLLWSTFSNADSLIIRFSSGKTQQVTLIELAVAVVNIQSQSTGTEGGGAVHNVTLYELYSNESSRKESDAVQNRKAARDKKSSYHLKWGSPKSGE
jgi:hypothetical protein